jgi:hypothetical protein
MSAAGPLPAVTATFRFYEELNDFLPPARRKREFSVPCARAATAKHMIEALGVPHTEVEVVLVNGESVGFEHVLRDGDRVAVYPKFEALDVTPLLRVREAPLRTTSFLADAHLGGLARLLRLAGFDTLYENGLTDAQIEARAREDGRIVLSRDRELLKRRGITHGCYVRALRPREQLREVIGRLDLARRLQPFSRCLACNAPLAPIDKGVVRDRLPPNVREGHDRFTACTGCGRVYWEGSHWRRMRAIVDALGEAAAAAAEHADPASPRAVWEFGQPPSPSS